ncbi:Membrane-spanning 4-domains subfamily A member 4A [Channa argus]|uniref:Membrane-spanning 4-domains subfamily A member 4A n=1 Tax=Channa argus TaxID=215402 RepID=A0A6G1Q4S2_CHAAH|nr:Membrane-spanning 4-domains subfamily A member 4A [Channa argus]KAK2900261.1 hypothetical protein Q8A73_013390 [Channa argus]
MADEAAVVEEGSSPAQSPLVAVSFQRNINRKQKFLEAEPKALGITQIGLSVFNIFCASVFLARGAHQLTSEIPLFVSSLLVAIAGSVAVAARNLHLPTLKACLGMQIVACGACVVNFICTLVKTADRPYEYWYHNRHGNNDMFRRIENILFNFCAESAIIQALLFAISVSLAAYCCKVVNCCGAAPKMPVITVQAPPDQQMAENTTTAEE